MPDANYGRVYSATYSNVPVYEFNVAGNHVMRRRSDDWINATHILKVAEFDKPARTRILEREVQKGVNEKVQGGYGKYQGTWVPLHDGRALAERNRVLEKLRPILDFVPGDRSPPPAPKHATAASNKPRTARQPAVARRAPAKPALSAVSEDLFETVSAHLNGSETPDNATVASESLLDDYDDTTHTSRNLLTGSRKRKREHRTQQIDALTLADQQHQLWADELLDYFMLLDSADPYGMPPDPPPTVNLDRPIDDKGHTALHWAAAMGDISVVKSLLQRGARIDALSKNGETPLMRAVMFTNNFDKQTMPKLVGLLLPTVAHTEWFGSTVFHHVSATTQSKSKYACARYYLESILNKLSETYAPADVEKILNVQDRNGDTAIMLAARNGARKCVRSLLGRNAATDICNDLGDTADEIILQLNNRRRNNRYRQASSSPFQIDAYGPGGLLDGNDGNGLGPLGATSPQATRRSEAASVLSSQIQPLVSAQFDKLAQAFDEEEVAEREAEFAEAERLSLRRRAELEAMARLDRELTAGAAAVCQTDDPEDQDSEAERRALDDMFRLAANRLERVHNAAIKPHCAVDPAAITNHNANNNNDEDSRDKAALLTAHLRATATRHAFRAAVVEGLARAGIGERQDEYKRLITGALGVREEDVEGMLAEIVGELEEGGVGVDGVGVGGAVSGKGGAGVVVSPV
ncbi:hypothetical protein B0A49_01273 [Cryomyces minteri]|uniref:HTH APSES-type domain-containing protein n=1 Tax=Cryomyces minteri TaxID=331657 RepID=A0A4U0XWJ8_9PEZI|nr:hypothetical protein B0A49_01273 [Cryomyces minteri]